MARGINKVTLIGNVGNDPEVRYMPNGDAVANITLATSENWKDKQTGQPQEKTEWHRIVFFGRVAEIVGEYVRKGSKLYIEGRLQTREWEKEGVKRYTTEIVVDMRGTLQLLDGAPSQQAPQQQRPQQQQRTQQQAPQQQRTQQQRPQQQAPQQQQYQAPTPNYDNFDDDIPFD